MQVSIFCAFFAFLLLTTEARPSRDDSVADSTADDDVAVDDSSLSAEIAGKHSLKTWYGAYLRAWANESDWFVGGSEDCKECEHWTIEDHNGKVAFKAYCSGKYLRANKESYVDLANEQLAHELWRPVKNDDGLWSFQSHHGTWLRAQPHGRISLQTEVNGGDEKFKLGKWAGKFGGIEGKRSLKSTHDTYLRASYCASGIEAVNVDTADHLKACEKWKIEETDGKVSLTPVYEPGKYLRANYDGSVSLSKTRLVDEMWTPLKHADGSWSLKSAYGRLLSASVDGSVTTVIDNVDSENFWIEAYDE